MDYDAIVTQALALLQHEQRLSYRVLKLRLQLDDDLLEALKKLASITALATCGQRRMTAESSKAPFLQCLGAWPRT